MDGERVKGVRGKGISANLCRSVAEERVKGVRGKGISANLCRSVAEEKVKGVRVKGKKRATRRCLDTPRQAGTTRQPATGESAPVPERSPVWWPASLR